MNAELKEQLTCSICLVIQETYADIVYSQGDRVCLECKKLTQASDDAAFDRDMWAGEVSRMY